MSAVALEVLALAPYPDVAPSTRFRVVQYVEALARLGIRIHLHPFVAADGYGALRGGGRSLSGAGAALGGARRLGGVLRRATDYDVVLVQRGVAPFLDRWALARLVHSRVPLVYDFDDAVYLPQEGGRTWVERLRHPAGATAAFCRAATWVLAGNRHLADFAVRAVGPARADRVRVLPSVVDTDRFVPRPAAAPGPPVVGWVGSDSTVPYLESLGDVLAALTRARPCRVVVVSGRRRPRLRGVDVELVPWTEEGEVAAFQSLDVGVYPLRDTAWTRGKCGFKALQYLACGVPCVASPVGVLRDIVRPGETGFLAADHEAWLAALERLVRDPRERAGLGAAGRRLVEERYSVRTAAPVLAELLRAAAAGRGRGIG